jgi:hypothetical protein
MRLTGIKVGDIVHADVRGQRFYAMVEQPDDGAVQVTSLNGKALGYSLLTARQVVGHWRRAAGSK